MTNCTRTEINILGIRSRTQPMERGDLEEYVEWASEIIDEKPQMNETNTREILIQEFIEVLDWSFRSLDIDGEYPVRMASRQTKVDYALMLEETPVVFVEVKGLDTKLNEDHREQITSYMHNEEGVNWGLLTNGEEYEFFMYDNSPSGFSLGMFKLKELPANFDVVRTLSKESVEAGESEERAEKLRERRRAVSRMRDEKEGIADDVTEAVTERVGESVTSVAETEAKEFVDRVVEELEKGGTVEARSVEKPETSRETEGVAETRDNAIVNTLARHEINGGGDAKVAVFPARKSGIEFLKKNNAWGFVRIGQDPDYVGMYIAKPAQEVRYFAEVDSIVPATEADLASPLESYVDMAKFDRDKKVVRFKDGSLHKLEDPIPHGEYTPQGMSYTTLEKFKQAEQTGDLR